MARKVRVEEKKRVPIITAATAQDIHEFRNYLAGNWTRTTPPRVVKSWEVSLDEECERIVFNGPLLNLRTLQEMLDKEKDFQAVRDKIGGEECVLVFHQRIKGMHPKQSVGMATVESIELSTLVPGPARKKIIATLPDHVVKGF